MKPQRETPQWLAKKMASDVINECTINMKRVKVLEPSAGTGALVDAVKSYNFDNFVFTCVELNQEKVDVLRSKGYETIHGDFLKLDFKDEKFDVIIAAPPFIGNIDTKHIQKMYSLLNTHGILVTLTSPYWVTNNEPHQVEFRDFLKTKNYNSTLLPDNTFTERNKTVPTMLMSIHKGNI